MTLKEILMLDEGECPGCPVCAPPRRTPRARPPAATRGVDARLGAPAAGSRALPGGLHPPGQLRRRGIPYVM